MRLFGICWVLAGAALAAAAQTPATPAPTNAPAAQTNAFLAQTNVPMWQTNALEVRKLSLEDCIQLALEHNLDVKIHRLNPEVSRFNLRAQYGYYEPTASVSGQHQYARSPGGIDPQGRVYAGTETDANTFNTGLQGLLPWGTSYGFGANVSDTYGTQPSFVPGPAQVFTNSFVDINTSRTISFLATNYSDVPSRRFFEAVNGGVGLFSFTQPLLRNFWINNARLQILLNKSNLKISELDLRAQVINTITAVEQAYFNLTFFQQNIQVQRMAVEFAEELVAENKKKVQVGALAPLDEQQAEYQAAGSRADLWGALGDESTGQRALKSLLSDDYTVWQNVSIQPVEPLVAVPEPFNLQESWRKGISLRPDLLQMKLSLEKQGYIVRFSKNQLFPELDLVGTAGYTASSLRNFDDALDQIGSRSNPFWTIGGQISYPLGSSTARYNYKAAKSTKQQIALQLAQLHQNILIQIEDAIAVARTSLQRVDATREARVYAEAAVDAEQKKLANGKSTSFEVLRVQRDLTTARYSEIQALANYNIGLAKLAQAEGSTLDRRRVTLDLR